MKKIFIICAIVLTLGITNVNAAESCEVKHTYTATKEISFPINGTIRSGKIYMAKLNGVTAFCLNRGKHAATTYSKTNSSNIRITAIMKKAYAYIQNANLSTQGGQMRYIIAQTAIWLDQEGAYQENSFKASVYSAIDSFYGWDSMTGARRAMVDNLITSFFNTQPYTGQLNIYAATTNPSGYQYFLVGLDTPTCPKDPIKKYCPSPNDTIDITDCVNSGKAYNTCVAERCPSSTTCEGYATKIVGNAAVCNNKGSENIGAFEEVVDTSQCVGVGGADEDGFIPSGKTIGQYCELYCKESVQQQYPGSIVNTVPVGTHIVWPTSTATQNTIWKNLYSLKYTGSKTCKIVVKTNKIKDAEGKTIEDKLREYAQTVGTYRGRYDLTCDSNYSEVDLANANSKVQQLAAEEESKKTLYDRKKSEVDSCNRKGETYSELDQSCMLERNEAISRGWITEAAAKAECTVQKPVNCGNYDSEEAAYKTAQNNLNAAKRILDELSRKKECKLFKNANSGADAILKELQSCVEYQFSINDLYNFESGTSISYSDPEYGKNNLITLNGNTSYSCVGCKSDITYQGILENSRGDIGQIYDNLYNAMNGKIITIQADATYSLPTGYQYTEKGTGKPLLNPGNNSINVGYTFLPISYNAKPKQYDLKIYVNSLGENGKFTAIANSQPYVCNYGVTNSPSVESCECPPDSKNAGSDLSSLLSDANGSMTCADAQTKYCGEKERYYCPSDQTIDITSCIREGKWESTCIEENCPGPDSDLRCPNDPSMKLNACVNSGHSYQYCVDNFCNGKNDPDYHCPKGTFNDGMDIKPCVFANIDMGLEAALQYCKDTVCPYKGGINIIYRTISLRNPFPGKTAGVNVSNTTINFSLDHLKGRYPGANWNSQTLVENQILFNRGVEGNKVYEKEPLYSFILDTSTIKEIRKYNDQQEKSGGYADFTLDCNSNGVACISSFVRNSTYGIVSGVCSNATQGNFYSCAES